MSLAYVDVCSISVSKSIPIKVTKLSYLHKRRTGGNMLSFIFFCLFMRYLIDIKHRITATPTHPEQHLTFLFPATTYSRT